MLAVILVGVAAGASGAVFLRIVRLARTGFARIDSLVVRMTIGGLIVGLITLWAPDVTGNGFAPIVALLERPGDAAQALSSPLLILLVLKILATAATVGAGAIGGLFTPSLMIGALAGSACAPLVAQWLGLPDSAVLLGVAGMAAGLAATTQAPLMSTLMVFEMTRESSFVFPLMVATVVAYATSMALGDNGAYSVIARHRARSERRGRLADATAGAIMRPLATPVTENMTLSAAMEVGLAGKNRFVFVTDDAARFHGAVWLQDVVARVNAGEADAAIGSSTYVKDLPVVYANQRLFDIWQTVVESPAERTPVLSDPQSRRLVGALNKSELLKQARQLFA
jgi:chloride channel protein, CIC family